MTGASSGIGKATVIKLVKLGYQVFGLARRYDKLAIAKIRLCLCVRILYVGSLQGRQAILEILNSNPVLKI